MVKVKMLSRAHEEGMEYYLPADRPFCNIFKSHEHADHRPVHRPSLDVRFGEGAARQGLVRGKAGKEKREPGAVGTVSTGDARKGDGEGT